MQHTSVLHAFIEIINEAEDLLTHIGCMYVRSNSSLFDSKCSNACVCVRQRQPQHVQEHNNSNSTAVLVVVAVPTPPQYHIVGGDSRDKFQVYIFEHIILVYNIS